MSTEWQTSKSIKRRLYTQSCMIDLLLISFFPLLLVLGYTLPLGIRESLVFSYSDPTVLAAFGSSFIHFGLGHLLTNVVLYALVVPVLYVLSATSNRQQQFRVFTFTAILAFPPVLSYLNLAIPRSAETYGASGVIMVFVGYLPLALAEYLDSNFDIGPIRTVSPVIFFASLVLISVLSLQSVLLRDLTVLIGTTGLVLATVLTTAWYVISAYEEMDDPQAKFRTAIRGTGYTDLPLLTVLLLFIVLMIAFPANPRAGNDVLNLYEHFIGYALAFIIAYINNLALQVSVRPE